MKHLIQLSEYVTGLNARIGFPNEHLAPNHLDELKAPMYSTCIGLMLKGFNDFDNQVKRYYDANPQKFELKKNQKEVKIIEPIAEIEEPAEVVEKEKDTKQKKAKATETPKEPKEPFWDKFKGRLIDLFKEEDDHVIK